MGKFIANPDSQIRNAVRGGYMAVFEAVADVMDQAAKLRQSGDRDGLVEHLRAVAELVTDDKIISLAVDSARQELEGYGVECAPSSTMEYQAHLDALPPHDRHVMLARQLIFQLGAARPEDNRTTLATRIVYHFEQAIAHKALGRKDQRIYLAMRAKVEA